MSYTVIHLIFNWSGAANFCFGWFWLSVWGEGSGWDFCGTIVYIWAMPTSPNGWSNWTCSGQVNRRRPTGWRPRKWELGLENPRLFSFSWRKPRFFFKMIGWLVGGRWFWSLLFYSWTYECSISTVAEWRRIWRIWTFHLWMTWKSWEHHVYHLFPWVFPWFSPFCLVRFRQVLLLGSEGLPEGAVFSLKWGRPADAVDRWRGGSPGQRCWYNCHKPKKYDII